jgi:ankyrin repeat protein
MTPRATMLSTLATLTAGALLMAPVGHAADASKDAPARSPELFMAVGQGNLAGVKALLASGANPNARNTIDMSILMIAAGTGNVEIMNTLIEAGAEVNAKSPFGTPLLFAAMSGGPSSVKALIARKADVNAVRPDRINTLMLAARDGRPELVQTLLATKPNLEAVDNHGGTALAFAARAGNVEATKLLLAAGAKIETPDVEGLTPLMQAAMNGNVEVVKLLLGKKASVGAKDKKGRTALHLVAEFSDSAATAQALLAAGADTNAKELKGNTALRLALAKGHDEVRKILAPTGNTPAVPALRTPRQAAEVSLKRLEHTMQVFGKRTGCISCHHEGLGRWATGFAKSHGYAINTALAQEQDKKIAGFFGQGDPLIKAALADPSKIKDVPIVDVGDLAPLYTSVFVGVSEHGTNTAYKGIPDSEWLLELRFSARADAVQRVHHDGDDRPPAEALCADDCPGRGRRSPAARAQVADHRAGER